MDILQNSLLDSAYFFDCVNTRYDPARASDFIGHAKKVLLPGERVIVVARASNCTQTVPIRQLADVYNGVIELGATVVGAHARICSGWDPSWLDPAISLALRLKASLVAISPDRYIRNFGYHPHRALPTRLDFHRLNTFGVRLLTLDNPDLAECDVRSEQTIRGLRGAVKKGERKNLLQQLVIDLNRHGHSLREIERMLEVEPNRTIVPYRTIGDWITERAILRSV